jgi:hypothetical protein
MRLTVERGEHIEEIAAEPRTLAMFAAVLDKARSGPVVEGRLLSGGRGLLGLPLVADHTIAPLTVQLRPYSAPLMGVDTP